MDSKKVKSRIQCCIDILRKLPTSQLTRNILGKNAFKR